LPVMSLIYGTDSPTQNVTTDAAKANFLQVSNIVMSLLLNQIAR
jgi:hypothetical protein